MTYSVYFQTTNGGRTVCAKNVTYERANALYDGLVTKYSDAPGFVCAGVKDSDTEKDVRSFLP